MRFIAIVLSLSGITFAHAGESQPARPSIKDLPGLQYRSINIQLGGFIASELVYRSDNVASDIATNFSRLPFSNSPGHGMTEVRGTERQSRISLLAQADLDDQARLAAFYELDFLGTTPTANAVESNSYAPRTRNIYATLDTLSGWHLLAGQGWSLVTINQKGISPRAELLPTTIDSQYMAGFNWARQWQMRVTKDWEKTYWLALSLENAQTTNVTGTLSPGTGNIWQIPAGTGMSANLSFNTWPDVIAKFAVDPGFGHYEIYGLARNFESLYGGTTAATQTNKQMLWTTAWGGGVTLPILPSQVDLITTGLLGRGIGRYGTSTTADATFASDGSLDPLFAYHYLTQLYWHLSNVVDLYAGFGREHVEQSSNGSGFGYGDGANADLSGCTTPGGTCTPHTKSVSQVSGGGWWSFYKGEFGLAKVGLQYSHTSLVSYADAGGYAPTTSIHMAYASLRYYPF